MILPVHERLRDHLKATLARVYDVPTDALGSISIEYPPNRQLGDLATPVAFELARRLRKAPRLIAQELAAALRPIEGISRVEAAPNGYLNIYLDRAAFFERIMPLGSDPRTGTGVRPRSEGKTIVEHTAINPT
jgi:arginyl-tRNA synthetase